MGRVYLCLGQNAELPYYFEKAKVHIWNIEELCYFIRENAWIMAVSYTHLDVYKRQPRQSDATKKIVPQRKSSDVRHLSKSPPQRGMS